MKVGQFGNAAVEAVYIFNNEKAKSPLEAWKIAIKRQTKSASSQLKGCPRDAFLGLCSEGLVVGISPGNYTSSERNKSYVVCAVSELKRCPELANNKSGLWSRVVEDGKAENSQMDVVCSLWKSGLIIKSDTE